MLPYHIWAGVLGFESCGLRCLERRYCAEGFWPLLDVLTFFDLHLEQDFLI